MKLGRMMLDTGIVLDMDDKAQVERARELVKREFFDARSPEYYEEKIVIEADKELTAEEITPCIK